jgi:hypothetical protein
MFLSHLPFILIVLNVGLQFGSCQFYVDIEHALPRFGKREPSESVQNMYSSFSQKMNKIIEEKENSKLESQIRMLYKLLGLNQHSVERK